MKPLYKYQKFDPNDGEKMSWLNNLLMTGRMHCSMYFAMNDPMEGMYDYLGEQNKEDRDIINTIKDGKESRRICCLTQSYQHNLMWAYYGDGHHGICIEVDSVLEQKGNYECFKIEYSDKRPLIGRNVSVKDAVNKILSTKSKQWKHEREIRYLINTGDTLLVHIHRVYAGCNMSSKNYLVLKKILEDVNRTKSAKDRVELVKLKKENIDYGWGIPIPCQ